MDKFLDDFITELLNKEGGYVDHPDDKGGPTNHGITQRVMEDFGFKGSVKDLSESNARYIYAQTYWFKPRISDLATVSPAVAREVFDTGVNCGTGTGIKFLQRCLNAFNQRGRLYPDLVADGLIGNKTVQALEAYIAYRGVTGGNVLLKALNCLQGAYYISLSELREQNESFVYGWIHHRVNLP